MRQRIILGIGTGRCGLASLAKILNRQPETACAFEDRPLLPWYHRNEQHTLQERFARFRRYDKAKVLGDCASFYLPYLEQAIQSEPDVRIVCLKRPCEEVVVSFCQHLDKTMPLPTNHWAMQPLPGWHHDPMRTRLYPHYDLQSREDGIRRYWTEYYRRVEQLMHQYPKHVRVFDVYEALNTEAGQREMLSFAGISPEMQQLCVGIRCDSLPNVQLPPKRQMSNDSLDPRRCVVLVPYTGSITPPCERALDELERRGYSVWRVGGYAAIDQGRSEMATRALIAGYEETMWIDSDIGFHPDSVHHLRSLQLPIVSGVYAQKGKRAIACQPLDNDNSLVFGDDGKLVEIQYAGGGFLLVRREVYLTMQQQLVLPVCNDRLQAPLIPFFEPMSRSFEDGHWYLPEDYAFSERARQCGFTIMADTRIRLWHYGPYAYGWEEAGLVHDRFDTFILNASQPPGYTPVETNAERKDTA